MIKLISAKIHPSDEETLSEIVALTQERMAVYAKNHPDFSCVIEKHEDDNYVIVKTLKLAEHIN